MNDSLIILVLLSVATLTFLICLMQQQAVRMGLVAQASAPPQATRQVPNTTDDDDTWFVPSNAAVRSNYNFGSERQATEAVPRVAIDSHLDAAAFAEPTGKILPIQAVIEDELVNAFDSAIEELTETVTDNKPTDWLNEQCSKIREGSLLTPSYRYNQQESVDTAAKWKARARPQNITASVANRLGDYHEKPNQSNFHRMEQMRLSLAKDLGTKMGPGLKKLSLSHSAN